MEIHIVLNHSPNHTCLVRELFPQMISESSFAGAWRGLSLLPNGYSQAAFRGSFEGVAPKNYPLGFRRIMNRLPSISDPSP